MEKHVHKEHVDETPVEHKPTKHEIEQLKADVARQNRMLLISLAGVLILAIAILVGFQAIKTHIKPTPWSYENAVLDVYNGKINDNQYPYSGIIFARQSNETLWRFQGKVNGSVFDITAYYAPKELESVPVSDYTFGTVMDKRGIVMTLNTSLDQVDTGAANAAVAAIEVGKIVGTKYNLLNKPTLTTLTQNTPGSNLSFTATCANASYTIGVIQFELGNQTQVISNGKCILVQGTTPPEIIKAADALMYHLLGIMQNPTEVAPQTPRQRVNTTAPQRTNTTV